MAQGFYEKMAEAKAAKKAKTGYQGVPVAKLMFNGKPVKFADHGTKK
jgi:hypothetical protein